MMFGGKKAALLVSFWSVGLKLCAYTVRRVLGQGAIFRKLRVENRPIFLLYFLLVSQSLLSAFGWAFSFF